MEVRPCLNPTKVLRNVEHALITQRLATTPPPCLRAFGNDTSSVFTHLWPMMLRLLHNRSCFMWQRTF